MSQVRHNYCGGGGGGVGKGGFKEGRGVGGGGVPLHGRRAYEVDGKFM